jgi:hypothetical protein
MSASWSFRAVAFRRMDPDGAPRWFAQSISVTIDAIAGDVGATPRRYVDIGAREFEALSLRAGCPAVADRDALVGMLGQQGTLTSVGGQSATALLTKATPLTHGGGPLFYADLEFLFLS